MRGSRGGSRHPLSNFKFLKIYIIKNYQKYALDPLPQLENSNKSTPWKKNCWSAHENDWLIDIWKHQSSKLKEQNIKKTNEHIFASLINTCLILDIIEIGPRGENICLGQVILDGQTDGWTDELITIARSQSGALITPVSNII